eukprot:COSAG01_NODE_1637_length_9660_cov_7.731932_1_plen_113_part_00
MSSLLAEGQGVGAATPGMRSCPLRLLLTPGESSRKEVPTAARVPAIICYILPAQYDTLSRGGLFQCVEISALLTQSDRSARHGDSALSRVQILAAADSCIHNIICIHTNRFP